MSDTLQSRKATPPCPMCAGDTTLKQVHREVSRRLEVFKCLVCAVEYPVVASLTRIDG
jgi:hypothetical protein